MNIHIFSLLFLFLPCNSVTAIALHIECVCVFCFLCLIKESEKDIIWEETFFFSWPFCGLKKL